MGKLSDGTCFDNSRTRGVPFEFVLGESDAARMAMIVRVASSRKFPNTQPEQAPKRNKLPAWLLRIGGFYP